MSALPQAPAMPRKLEPIHFDNDGFPGFIAMAWTSAPLMLTDKLMKLTDEQEGRNLLLQLLPEWNFTDYTGAPVPHTPEGFDLLPQLLISRMIGRYKLLTMGFNGEEVEKKLSVPFVEPSPTTSPPDKQTTPDQSPSST